MSDGTSGSITKWYAPHSDGSGPDCGSDGCFTYSAVLDTYTFMAQDILNDLTWSGTITITEEKAA